MFTFPTIPCFLTIFKVFTIFKFLTTLGTTNVTSSSLHAVIILAGQPGHLSRVLTVYAESACSPGVFLECLLSADMTVHGFTLVSVSCECNSNCDFLYIKHNHVYREEQTQIYICEIGLIENTL